MWQQKRGSWVLMTLVTGRGYRTCCVEQQPAWKAYISYMSEGTLVRTISINDSHSVEYLHYFRRGRATSRARLSKPSFTTFKVCALRETGLMCSEAIMSISFQDSASSVEMGVNHKFVFELQLLASNFGRDGLSLSRTRRQLSRRPSFQSIRARST